MTQAIRSYHDLGSNEAQKRSCLPEKSQVHKTARCGSQTTMSSSPLLPTPHMLQKLFRQGSTIEGERPIRKSTTGSLDAVFTEIWSLLHNL